MRRNTKLKGNLLLLLTALIWGSSFVAQSVGMEKIEPNTFNGIRTWLGALVLVPFILVRRRGKSAQEKARENRKILLFGGLVCGVLLCIASTVQTYGLKYTTAGKSGFITAMYMIVVPLLGFVFHKRPTRIALFSAAVAVCGMSLLCLRGTDITNVNIGDFLTLLCAVVFAFHIMAIDYFSPQVDGVKLACLQFFVSGAVNIVLMLLLEKPQPAVVMDCTLPVLYSGVMSCGVAYTLQIIAQKYTDPTSASILMSLESVFAVLSGALLLHERMTAHEILGCVLMFAAILLVQLPDDFFQKRRKA